MAIVNLTPIAETVQGFQLVTAADMWTSLTWLAANGYDGNVQYGGGTWTLTFRVAGDTYPRETYSATIGDWCIIRNGTIATVCPAENFAALYTVT